MNKYIISLIPEMEDKENLNNIKKQENILQWDHTATRPVGMLTIQPMTTHYLHLGSMLCYCITYREK